MKMKHEGWEGDFCPLLKECILAKQSFGIGWNGRCKSELFLTMIFSHWCTSKAESRYER